jgi:hypothetical protein
VSKLKFKKIATTYLSVFVIFILLSTVFVLATTLISFSGHIPGNDNFFNTSRPNFNVTVIGTNQSYNLSLWVNGQFNGSVIVANNTNVNITTLSTLTDGTYNWTFNASNGSVYNVTVPTFNFTVDTTIPNITYHSSSIGNNTNKSDNSFYVNVSVNETNFGNITFLIMNSTGVINTTRSNLSTTTGYNFSDMGDSIYEYNVTVVDNASNKNVTLTRTITIDSSSPVLNVGVSASPIAYNTEITFTCDVTDLIDTTPVTTLSIKRPGDAGFTTITSLVYSDTALDGVYTFRCQGSDDSGNTRATDVDFSVDPPGSSIESSSSGGSSSSSSSPSLAPESEDTEEVSEINTDVVLVEVASYDYSGSVGDVFDLTIKMSVSDEEEEHSVTIENVDFEGQSATLVVESDPQEVYLNVGETKELDVNGDNIADLSLTLVTVNEDGTIDLIVKELTLAEEPLADELPPSTSKKSKAWVLVLVLVLIVVSFGIYWTMQNKSSNKPRKRK